MDDSRPMMTTAQLAEFLSVSTRTIRRMVADGEIPVVWVRARARYDARAVERALMESGLSG